jgi:hypothetical protein
MKALKLNTLFKNCEFIVLLTECFLIISINLLKGDNKWFIFLKLFKIVS